jgi:G3E family GTPase
MSILLPIPLIIIHGSLGSGKTTTLKKILQQPEADGALVIENDIAEWNVDAEALAHDHIHAIPISGGCICCGSVNDLKHILEEIIASKQARTVIIETTGVAKVTSLLAWLSFQPTLSEKYVIQQVIMVCDVHIDPVQAVKERKDDMAVSDIILITKTDMVSEEQYMRWSQILTSEFKDKYITLPDDLFWQKRIFSQISAWYYSFPERGNTIGTHTEVQSYVIPFRTSVKDEIVYTLKRVWKIEHGTILRVKGFVVDNSGEWWHIEATPNHITIEQTQPASRSALIFIGTSLIKKDIEAALIHP